MTDRRPLTRVARGLGLAVTALTAGALWTARPQAQPRPPFAIVGARILDGSGNEPFTGTIVVSGGRISAVGRQVEAPADAEKIDGTGKTVLPGLIDTALRASLVEAGDAGRRRLGLLLAAGITTAAVPDGAAVPVAAADVAQPRLLAAVAADAPGRAAALPPAVRERRNGTLAVSLADDPRAGVAAVRPLNARIAFSGLAREDAGLDVAAATASGLTPLEAVTAMTGSGAWALGLQSDRGLLAPSMRADLVVVAGDPTVSLEALAHVERVFLGGVEVDRAALTRPPPEPAVSTAAATPAASPAATSKAPAPARGRGRGAKGSKAGPAPVAPAAAVTDTPPATSAPEATPDAASATAAASAASPSVAAVRLREALLDDFERGDSVSAIGPAWVGSGSDGAGAATTMLMGRVVKGLRDHALLLSARMGGGRDPFARAALKLDAGDRPVDVSRFRGLRFDARGEGRYRVVFVTKAVGDGRFHESYFSGSPLWTPTSIPFASIDQNGAGAHVPWTGRDVVEVRFEMVRDAGRFGWLELDNVTFY